MEDHHSRSHALVLEEDGDFADLRLAIDDMGQVLVGLTEFDPQDVKCQGSYCPHEYCAGGYEA